MPGLSESLNASSAPGRLATSAVLLLSALTIMANATIAPSLPGLKAHFAALPGVETFSGLLLVLPSLAIVLSAGLMGWAADRWNRQVLLGVCGALYALGGTSGLWLSDPMLLLAGRFVLGLGVAGTMTLSTTWGADLWHGPARARLLGWQGAAMSAGGVVVMLLGGALAHWHWRGAFAAYGLVVPATLLALIAFAPYAAARRQARAQADAALSREPAARAAPPARFPWRAYALVGTLGFLFMATFYIMPTRAPFLLAGKGIHNTLWIAGVMATMTLTSVPGALGYGRLRRFVSASFVFGFSYALMGLGLWLVASASTLPFFFLGSAVIGIGMGPSMPNYMTFFMAYVPPPLRGRAAGLLTTAFFAGQFASPLVSAPLVVLLGLTGAFKALATFLIVLGGLLIWRAQSGELLPPPPPLNA